MNFSSKENFHSTSEFPRKQVRFNSSELSSPSDVQTPRPLGEIQNLKGNKLKLFSQVDSKINSRQTEHVSKNVLSNDIPYLPPELCQFQFKNSDADFSVPKPSSDLELSVFDSPSLVDNGKNIRDLILDKKLLENDTPYSFSATQVPLRRPDVADISKGLVNSAAQSTKQFQCNSDSTLDFFTKPLTNVPEEIRWRPIDTEKRLPDKVAGINHRTTQKHMQTVKNGMQNKIQKCNDKQNCCGNNVKERNTECGNRCCGCTGQDKTVEQYRERSCQCCESVPRRQALRCCAYEAIETCQRECDSRRVTKKTPIDPVEAKRQAILEKYKDKDDVKVVKTNDAEPTVADLYKIIQSQNDQLQNLQKQFEQFMAVKMNDDSPRLAHKNRQCSNEQVQYNNVNCVEHISIGVMTSFEMIRSSNYVGAQAATHIDECVQTSVTQLSNECNKGQIINNNERPLNVAKLSSPVQMLDEIPKAPVAGRNFLDGIDRVNNVPSPKRCVSGQVLDRIVEENHVDDKRCEVRHRGSGEQQAKGGGTKRNEGWTFYNNVVNRVNDILNSPPNTNDSKQKLSPSPVQVPETHPPRIETSNERQQPTSYRAPVDQRQREVAKPSQPVIAGFERPLSELSLHMKQLASKYNIPVANVTSRAQPTFRRVVNPMDHAGDVMGPGDLGRVAYGFDNRNMMMASNNGHAVHHNRAMQNHYEGQFEFMEDVAVAGPRRMEPMEFLNKQVYCGGDMSFATMQYIQRCQLLTVTNEHPSPAPIATTPNRPLPPAYRNPSRILDITALKHQPKLL